jgi:ABC-type polysaccharide/polyol phosphate export permease
MDSTHTTSEALMDSTQVAHTPLSHTSTTSRKIQAAKERKLAMKDIVDGLLQWRIWFTLAYQDVKLRYRRSVLGPFWITISMAITTYSMGYLYGHLFHTDLQIYFPFLVSGMLSWGLISAQLSDTTDAFSGMESMIKQIKLPYSLYIHRVVTRNIITFFHNIIVIVPIIAIFHEYAKINFNTLLLIPGLIVIYYNAITFGLMFAMIGARYRDIAQVIKSMIQVAFFLTPVMWSPDILPAKDKFIVLLNPFYAFVELVRKPLLGQIPGMSTLIMAVIVSVIGTYLCFNMLSKYRSRIVYWL